MSQVSQRQVLHQKVHPSMGDDPQMRHTRSALSNLQAAPVKGPSSPLAGFLTSAVLERNLTYQLHSQHTELEPPVCLLEETF